MKKIYTLLLFMFALTVNNARSADVVLRFSALHTCEHAQLDSILIENLTKGGATTLHWPDTILSLIYTSVRTLEDPSYGFGISRVFPNPFTGQTSIDLDVHESNQFVLSVHDLNGRLLASDGLWLSRGTHRWVFYANQQQVYVFSVASPMDIKQQVIVQIPGSGGSSASLVYTGARTVEALPEKSAFKSSAFDYNAGDELRFSAYVGGDVETITDTPAASKDYTFDVANQIPDPPSAIRGEPSVEANQAGLVYEVDEVSGLEYLWTVPSGWSVREGQGQHAITVDAGVESGDIRVVAENACGSSAESILSVVVNFTLVVEALPSEGGTVEGGGSYTEGTQVSLVATPAEGWVFLNWTAEDGAEVSDQPSFTFTMPAEDVELVANFIVDASGGPGIVYGKGVTDIDGNDYVTVIIGEQEWMAENLRVSSYRNGDAIPRGLDAEGWGNATDGAYAVYPYNYAGGIDSDEEMIAAYGKLYNWYAVDNASGLCPTGWRMPKREDWEELIDHVVDLGYPNDNVLNGAGNALRSCRQLGSVYGGDCDTNEHPRWDRVDTHYGFDAVGFSGLPAGLCYPDLRFSTQRQYAHWWSATDTGTGHGSAFRWVLDVARGDIGRVGNEKGFGFSVRCIRDDAPAPGTVTDIDGNIYPTVIIGQQEWMAENLRVTRDAAGNDITRYCYDDDPDWCEIYGGLYSWNTLMNGEQSSNDQPGGVQGICPTGWQVPSNADWDLLVDYIVNQGFPNEWDNPNGAANALKSCRQIDSPLEGDCNTSEHPRWNMHGTHNGFDQYGFSALPAGTRLVSVGSGGGAVFNYSNIGEQGYWWTSTASDHLNAYRKRIFHHIGNIGGEPIRKSTSISVRCVRYITGEQDNYTLSLQANPAAGGTVSGGGEYRFGDEVPIEAVADTGWEFVNWTGEDSTEVSDQSGFTFTMPAEDVDLVANFIVDDSGGPGVIYGEGVTDIDGNEYVTIIVGGQEWMAENLRVGRYRNGDAIPRGLSNLEWENTREGAYAIYPHTGGDWPDEPVDGINSDEEMVASYGKLYNWYTVADPRGLCPVGWHVPTDAQWEQLVNYLMNEYGYHNDWGDNIHGAGNALKSCRQVNAPTEVNCNVNEHPRWNAHETHYGHDAFGFSALPGGFRGTNGGFGNIGGAALWWSADEYSDAEAWERGVYSSSGPVGRFRSSKSYGYSVRCIRNDE